ncbi:hypothetical protein ACFZCU_09520 [Streptomyces canus]|uniref:hypothetical protein n=1 Tax=Streptomyces canus TaxID=58343 RepID=UPI0036EA4948
MTVTRHREVGVDVDGPRPGLPVEPFAQWTRKEAVVKAVAGAVAPGISGDDYRGVLLGVARTVTFDDPAAPDPAEVPLSDSGSGADERSPFG